MDNEKLDITVTEELRIEKAREKAKPYIEEFRSAFRKVSTRADEHLENMAFYEGKQYQLSKYKISRPWVVRMRTPYASVNIDTRVASLIASDYRGDLVPMDPKDKDAIESLNNFKNDEWERMNLNQKVNEAIKISAIVREGYIHLRWVDKAMGSRQGYLEADVIDMPSSIYIDPTALRFKDARYITVLSRRNRYEMMETYPKFKGYFDNTGGHFSPQDRGEVYLNVDYNSEQTDVLTMLTHYRKEKGVIKKYVVVEDVLVDEIELDGLTRFPIAQMPWKRENGSPYGRGLMDDLIDLQKGINAIESAVTNTAIAYSAPSYGVKKGSGLNPKEIAVAIGAPGMVVAVEGPINEAIAPLNLPKLDNAVLGVKQDFVNIMDRIAGISNPYLGSVGTAGNTSSGTKMALERARIIEADVIHNIENFVEDLTQILIEYIGAQYAGEVVTSRQVDRATGEAQFRENNIPVDTDELEWSFFINLSAKTSYSKEREKEMVLELYQMQHQYKDDIKLINQLDILESYDLSNKEILTDRFKKLTQQSDEQKAQLIQQLVTNGDQLGVDPGMVQQAIVELMSGSEETPVVDALMQEMQRMAQQQAQLRQQTMEQATLDMQQAGVPGQAIQMATGQAPAVMPPQTGGEMM